MVPTTLGLNLVTHVARTQFMLLDEEIINLRNEKNKTKISI